MAPTLIVLALVALGVGIVVWATRKKPGATDPREADTAWNDPVTPGESLPADAPTPVASSEEHRP